jgi:hypothetical protein
MSNKIRANKLKCSECKKSKPIENYSKCQLKQESKRRCIDCAEKKRLANLDSSPSTGRAKGDPHLEEVVFDGFYYTSFNPESSVRSEKKKSNVIDNGPNSARNPLGINQHTDNATPFPLLSDNRQGVKLRKVKTSLKDSCDKVLNNIDDVDLQEAAKSKYVPALYEKDLDVSNHRFDVDNGQLIQQGLRDCYSSIPSNSPIRASFIQSIFPQGIDAQFIADTLEIDVSCVRRSLRADVEHLDFYLKDLGFVRDRLDEKRTDLEDWFVKRCGPPSGRHKRYYTYGMVRRVEFKAAYLLL